MSLSSLSLTKRLLVIVALGALTAGCFQPMYAERTLNGEPALRERLSSVDVTEIRTSNPRDARLGVEVRNGLLFNFTGGSGSLPASHRLVVRMSSQRASTIVDITTSRPEIENYGIDVSYQLVEVATNKVVLQATTFARVSYDAPGQEQRFARIRGLRDAENRASKLIADNITQRLSSFFVAGT